MSRNQHYVYPDGFSHRYSLETLGAIQFAQNASAPSVLHRWDQRFADALLEAHEIIQTLEGELAEALDERLLVAYETK